MDNLGRCSWEGLFRGAVFIIREDSVIGGGVVGVLEGFVVIIRDFLYLGVVVSSVC